MTRTIIIEEADNGQRLDRWLQSTYPHITYPFIQKALRKGDIRVEGKKVEGKERLETGQTVRLPPAFFHAESAGNIRPLQDSEIELARSLVVYEDKYILALNKPHGLATQGGSKTYKHVDRLLMAFEVHGEKPKLVHRLDKDTSGIMIVAKSRAIAEKLGNDFKHRGIDKTYVAITLDTPKSHKDSVRAKLIKRPTPDGEKVVVDREEGKPALTHYRVLSFSGRDAACVALRPDTGRMHQLRVHMAHIHTPILGDHKYGGMIMEGPQAEAAQERMWLHALYLHLRHPVTDEPLSLCAPLPQNMRDWLDKWNMTVPTVSDTDSPIDPMDEAA